MSHHNLHLFPLESLDPADQPPRRIEGPDLDAMFHPLFLDPIEAQGYYHILLTQTDWQQGYIWGGGNQRKEPRLTAAYGDRIYTYSGRKMEPNPQWTPTLLVLLDKVKTALNHPFNFLLLNLYRDGTDSIGEHADDETELGAEPVIASISLGVPRIFHLRRKDHSCRPIDILLTSGSMLVMAGTTQDYWKHSVPKVKEEIGPRINLTFRYIHP